MANESFFTSTQAHENVSDITDIEESFLNSTEIYDSLFSSTQMFNDTNSTQIYDSSEHLSEIHENLINCFGNDETAFSINETAFTINSICEWTSGIFSTSWDMVLTTEVVLNCIVCILGILGNIYALVIIFRMTLDTFFHKWRRSMVICDLLVLVCDFHQVTIARVFRSFLAYQNYSMSFYTYLWVILYPIRKMIETVSVWITITVVVERCVFVWRGPKALSLCRYRTPGILFLFIIILVTSINFPRFREYQVRKCYDTEFNMCSHEIRKTHASDIIQNYRDILDWIYVCVTYIAPFLILIISNCFLWRTMHKSNVNQEKSEEIEPEFNSVRTIFVFVLLFCVCRLLKLVEDVYSNVGINVEFMTPFSNLMLSVNSAVNFIIYLEKV